MILIGLNIYSSFKIIINIQISFIFIFIHFFSDYHIWKLFIILINIFSIYNKLINSYRITLFLNIYITDFHIKVVNLEIFLSPGKWGATFNL